MSAEESAATELAPGVYECARHPGVETGLRCGRCETPICPRCMVLSPVGARCPACAPVTRVPMYTVKRRDILAAGGASLVGGIVMGFLWAWVGIWFSYGFFLIFLGIGLGYAFTRILDWATRGKRGPVMVAFAIGGIVIAWGMQWVLGIPAQIVRFELLAVGIGGYFAYQNLR